MRVIIISIFLLFVWSCDRSVNNHQPGNDAQETVGNFNLDTSKIENFNIDCSIRAIYPVSADACWFAGSRGQFGFTIDGGQTWNIDSIQHTDQPQLEFRSIARAGDAVLLLSIASPSLLYRTTDMGDSWKIVYRENDSLAFYDSMDFWNNKDGIAMGDPTDSCMSVILTSDGGKSWTKVPCDCLPETMNGEAAFAASNSNLALYGDHAWLVSGGAKARVFHSPDKGLNWEAYQTPIVEGGTMTGIFSCDFFDANTGVIFGGNWEEMGVTKNNKAITYDGGKSWQLIAQGETPGYRSCVQFLSDTSPNSMIAVGIPGVSITNDGGMTWKDVKNQSFYTVRKAESVLWFGGSNGMARLEM